MGVRFQVLINGESVCVAGIDGLGVLGVCLDRVQRIGENERLTLRVGGLGRYDPQWETDCHVHWPLPRDVQPGDEVVIRILPAGEYDNPREIKTQPFGSPE